MNNEDRFERAIETVMQDRSPRSQIGSLTEDQRRMICMAQLLRGSRGQEVAAAFRQRLHARLFPPRRHISRRAAFLSGLGALAAGMVGAVGLNRAMEPAAPRKLPPLVGANGHWYPVASLAALPDGAIRTFTAGGVQGFLIHHRGELYALSRVCTHMGCTLQANRARQTFDCPCHEAKFDLSGRLTFGPGQYDEPLPPLPPIRTRVRGGKVEVLAV
jgi:nitrite reductase/ring-hydroxylating ferredoxin subunit